MDAKGLKIRLYTEDDRPELERWYALDNDKLPEARYLGTGFVLYTEKENVAVGFFIETETEIGLYEFMQTNPDASWVTRGKAVKLLTEFIMGHAKSLGYSLVMGMTPSHKNSILNLYRKMGAWISPWDLKLISRRI